MFGVIYLHIGLDKTGSSAIQNACYANRVALREMGILYPIDYWHAQFGSVWLDDPATYFFNTAQGRERRPLDEIRRQDADYLEALNAEIALSNAKTLIMSYEGFSELDELALRRMLSYFEKVSQQTKVIFYCRDPLSYASSAISQLAKSGLDTTHTPPIHAYHDICEKFSSVFGKENIVVRNFARESLLQGDVRQDFFSAIGVPPSDVAKFLLADGQDNASLSAEAILIAQSLIELRDAETSTSGAFGVRYAKLLEQIAGQKYYLTKRQFDDVIARSRPHVDYLLEHFNIDIRPHASLVCKEKSASFGPEFLSSIARMLQQFSGTTYSAMQYNADELALLDRQVLDPALTIHSVKLDSLSNGVRGTMMTFEVDFFVARDLHELSVGIHIFDAKHRWIYGTNSNLLGARPFDVSEGSHCASYYLVADLPPGKYTAGFSFNENRDGTSVELVWQGRSCEFEITAREAARGVGYVDLSASVGIRPTSLARPDAKVLVASGGLRVLAAMPEMICGQVATISVEVRNGTAHLWRGDVFRPISVSYHWLRSSGEILSFEGLRSPIPPAGIGPGESVSIDMQVEAPLEPGQHNLVLTMVQDGISWFESLGFEPVTLAVLVRAG